MFCFSYYTFLHVFEEVKCQINLRIVTSTVSILNLDLKFIYKSYCAHCTNKEKINYKCNK